MVARLVRKGGALRQRTIAEGKIQEAAALDSFSRDDDDDEPRPAMDEIGPDRTKVARIGRTPNRAEQAPQDQEPFFR